MSQLKASKAAMSAAVSSIALCAPKVEPAPLQPSSDMSYAWVLRLMQAEGGGILRLLHRLLGCEADVLDAYQDCFCKLAGRGGPGGLANAKAYAYRTATNIAIELLRTRKRREGHWPAIVEHRTANESVESVESDGSAESNPEARLEALRNAIPKLPAHLRSVVVLRDLGCLSYETVGRMLGIDPATARVYRRHAVVKLAELLGEEVVA